MPLTRDITESSATTTTSAGTRTSRRRQQRPAELQDQEKPTHEAVLLSHTSQHLTLRRYDVSPDNLECGVGSVASQYVCILSATLCLSVDVC